MKRVTELIVRTADLVEAEGRALRETVRGEAREVRHWIGRFGVGIAFLFAAAPLMIGGLCLLLAGLYMALDGPMGPAGAAALTGVITLLTGGGLLWAFRSILL